MKRIIKDTLVLFAITLIAGLLLGGVYSITKTPIEAQTKAKAEKAYKAVFYKYYEQVTDAEGAADSIVSEMSFDEWSADELTALSQGFAAELGDNTANTLDGLVTAYDSEGKVTGFVMTITNSEAYDGSIQMSVGILAAALTFLIVNHRDISVHGNCTERTFLRAEGTADAACLAGIHYRLALFR